MELNQDLLEAALVALAALLGGALGLALTALVLKYAATWAKDFVAVVREYTPQVVRHVDEPRDPALAALDRLLDRLYKGNWDEWAARILPPLLYAAADAIAASDVPPAQEVNLAETPK